MLNLGFENYVSIEYVIAICGNPTASPIKKLLQSSKNNSPDKVLDFTNGNALKSIVYLKDGTSLLSSVSSKTLKERFVMAKENSIEPLDVK